VVIEQEVGERAPLLLSLRYAEVVCHGCEFGFHTSQSGGALVRVEEPPSDLVEQPYGATTFSMRDRAAVVPEISAK
jgi:hypothetical protein